MPTSLSQEIIPSKSTNGSVKMSSKRTSTERRKTESHQDDLVDEADRRSEMDHEDLERDS